MFKQLITLVLIILFSLEASASLTLRNSFEAAKQNMESIKRAEALITQSKELKIQTRAALLPRLNAVGSYSKIERPRAAGTSPFLLTEQYSAAIRLVQPLFRGGTVSAYELSKDNILLTKFQKEATEINLYQLIINAYYQLNIAQVDKKNVEELLKFSRERVNEIRERTNIGRSRKGELVEAQAQLLTAESQFQHTLMVLQEAEKNFEFYTGLKAQEIKLQSEIPKLKKTVSGYLIKIKDRPDLLATKQETKMAERKISIAKGEHAPSVDLTSNYYLKRTGILESSDWDVGVAVVIPLYEGGATESSVREAAQDKRIAELRTNELQRVAERDVAISYQNIIQLQEQLKYLKKALVKAEEAYRLNKKDYQHGLVTNLDVLQSLNLFIETKRSYSNLLSLMHLNYNNLEALVGVLP
jgi:outer membrane protein